MNKRPTIIFWLSLVTWIGVSALLITGSNLLLLDWGGVPSGTILTWLGIICLPVSIYSGSEPLRTSTSFGFRIIRRFAILTFLFALSWGFVAYALAGNWSFNFGPKEQFVGSPRAYYYFYIFTVVTVSMSFLLLFWLSTFQFLLNRKRKTL